LFDYFLSNLQVGQTIIIQAKAASQDFQEFEITSAVTIVNPNTANAYATIPVTLTSSGGVGTTGFANDAELELIISQQGIQGLQGVQGNQGIQGAQGVQGLQGLQGLLGFQGTQGNQGTQGTQGLQGLQGLLGLQGTQGVQSVQGVQGLQGLTGDESKINATDDTTTNASFYPVMVAAAGSSQTATVTTTKLYFNPSTGTINATEVNTLSDLTMKSDLVELADPLTMLSQVSGYKFKFTESGKQSVGVIAQDVEKVLPEIVTTNDKGNKSISYNGIVALLIEAVKQQQATIDELKKKLQ